MGEGGDEVSNGGCHGRKGSLLGFHQMELFSKQGPQQALLPELMGWVDVTEDSCSFKYLISKSHSLKKRM